MAGYTFHHEPTTTTTENQGDDLTKHVWNDMTNMVDTMNNCVASFSKFSLNAHQYMNGMRKQDRL